MATVDQNNPLWMLPNNEQDLFLIFYATIEPPFY